MISMLKLAKVVVLTIEQENLHLMLNYKVMRVINFATFGDKQHFSPRKYILSDVKTKFE